MGRKTIGIIIFLMLVVGTFISYQIIRYSSIEKYTVSKDGKVITSKNGQQYVGDGTDFMSIQSVSTGKQIGKTDDTGVVYEIKGQQGHDWISFNITDEMSMPEIYHKKQIKTFSIFNKEIKSVRLGENKGLLQATGIDVVSSKEKPILKELEETIEQTGRPQKVKFNRIISLQIFFDEYKGITYVVFANITADNKVYISKVNNDNSVRAGSLLSKWVLQNAHK